MANEKQEGVVDVFEKLIEDIRVELNRMTKGGWPADRFAFGQLKKLEHDRPPRIEWEELGGAIETARLQGGNAGGIAQDSADFTVTVWHLSMGSCRAALHNLAAATRVVAQGPNHQFGRYDWVDDGQAKKGRKLKCTVTLKVPVSSEAVPEAAIAESTHETIVGGEVVC